MERPRPGGLTWIAILAILLGILITIGGLISLAELTFQDFLYQFSEIPAPSDASPELLERIERHREIRDAVFETQRAWNPVGWVLAGLSVVFGIALITAARLSFVLSRFGRKLLIATFLAGVAFDVARSAVAVVMTIQKTQVVQGFIIDAADRASANTDVMGAAMGLGIAASVAWATIKVLFYLSGVIYLTRPRLRDLFELGVSS